MKVHAWTQSIHLNQSQRCHEVVGLKRLKNLFKAIHGKSRTTTPQSTVTGRLYEQPHREGSYTSSFVSPSKMNTPPIVTSKVASAQTPQSPYKPCSPPNSCHVTSEFCFHSHSDFFKAMDHTLRNCFIIHNVQPVHAQFLGTLLLGLVK